VVEYVSNENIVKRPKIQRSFEDDRKRHIFTNFRKATAELSKIEGRVTRSMAKQKKILQNAPLLKVNKEYLIPNSSGGYDSLSSEEEEKDDDETFKEEIKSIPKQFDDELLFFNETVSDKNIKSRDKNRNDRGCVIFPKTETEFENIKSLFQNNQELAEFVKDGPDMTNETLVEDVSINPANEKSEQAPLPPQSKMNGFYIPIESPFIELLGYLVLFPTGGRSKEDVKKQKNRQLGLLLQFFLHLHLFFHHLSL